MGYFDRAGAPPAIPVPAGAQLWDDEGAPTLAWRRPLGGCDGYAVLRGDSPEALAEVARLPAAATRWPVPAAGGPWLAVACLRAGIVGASGAPVRVAACAQPDCEAERTPVEDLPAPQPVAASEHACQCCTPPRPLAPDDGALACPHTGELYAAMATGGLARAAALPFGLCRCCEVRQPLIRCGDEVTCLARPEQAYIRQGSVFVPRPPGEERVALTDANLIDAALRANSALLGVNGVFVGGGN
ncbi:MAG: hypothetical protein HGA45_04030 [Chloroflexales bacterium]|nr:hypothetical protein [Chloroflexales bacterium]